jgi:hypothetical protein
MPRYRQRPFMFLSHKDWPDEHRLLDRSVGLTDARH